ncbi:AraC family transcriptional regulator [Hoeflea ulvae]|uniref:AraC family transcriptional regulator n=1 Tax=Hoeflea ulvae TaxID=2983764 RepID=A0ABT3YG48_9HYPH|nr:AraC family transcriptional regulator [Hoeflea ulvae]MCY0094868.1 AraC family transcriptional regulator [Hoeflea ulvae]
MTDPLAEMVTLLQPGALLSKVASGAGAWRVERPATGQPFYCVVMEGSVRLETDGQAPIDLEQGDFVLIPSVVGFSMSNTGQETATVDPLTVTMRVDEIRHGDPLAPANARVLIGHFAFGSDDAGLLVSLLPQLIHVRGEARLSQIVGLVRDEARDQRPARNVILGHLLEVMLIEALRSSAGTAASPGLLRGLADVRLAAAIRKIHESPERAWTIAALAHEASLSRSAFFDRFSRAMGMTPMEYLLSWRMALAKRLLRRREGTIEAIAGQVGYGSASTFSIAFTRSVGMPPTRYARADTEPNRR